MASHDHDPDRWRRLQAIVDAALDTPECERESLLTRSCVGDPDLRAEAAPDALGTAVRDGLVAASRQFPTLSATVDHLEHFRPGKPTPTHRIEDLSG